MLLSATVERSAESVVPPNIDLGGYFGSKFDARDKILGCGSSVAC